MVVVINFYHSFVAKYVIIQFGVIKFVSTFHTLKFMHVSTVCVLDICTRHRPRPDCAATQTPSLWWNCCVFNIHVTDANGECASCQSIECSTVWGERKFGILCFSSIAPKTADKYVGCLHYIAASKLTQFSDIIQQTNTDCLSHRIRAELMIKISNRPGYLILDPTTWRMTLNYDHWHQRLYENDTIRLLTCTRLSFVVIGQCHLYFLHGCSINICHAAC